ncbi:Alpha/beta hydrolase fold-3 [Dillenia turbinata]|uniref:Alpha/beta hydrolase fold-3 n=1 Tax=Dillenia turbinata TaxID=194707 RepID=A0AAN8ZJX1_9MAGN
MDFHPYGLWRLSLPKGETRDHPLANPIGRASSSLTSVSLEPILVIMGGKYLLKDRVKDHANKLKEFGKEIDYVEFDGEEHSFFTNDPFSDSSKRMLHVIEQFMSKTSN